MSFLYLILFWIINQIAYFLANIVTMALFFGMILLVVGAIAVAGTLANLLKRK